MTKALQNMKKELERLRDVRARQWAKLQHLNHRIEEYEKTVAHREELERGS